jgi:hypothetical protein
MEQALYAGRLESKHRKQENFNTNKKSGQKQKE